MLGSLIELLGWDKILDPLDVLDILLLWFVVYQVLLLIRRTRAVQMIYGMIAVIFLWVATAPGWIFPLKAVHWVLGYLLLYGPFALIVLFQSPIRQTLAHFGRYPFGKFRSVDSRRELIEEIALAATAMGSRRIGALIVLERVHGLRNYIETGIEMDAVVSYDLLINVFTPRTPLHDGAVIISNGRIQAASCFLPLSTDPYISRQFGTRHRAAIGLSQETDAIVIVVSEERGSVSVAMDGALHQDLDTRSTQAFLEQNLGIDRPSGLAWSGWLGRRGSTNTKESGSKNAVETARP